METRRIHVPVPAQQVVANLLKAGVTHDQLGLLSGDDGTHLALRVGAMLYPEPPDLDLEDFASAVAHVAPRVPQGVSYLLLITVPRWGTVGQLALGPVGARYPEDWPPAYFSQRIVLRLRAPKSIESCVCRLIDDPALGKWGCNATPIGGHAQARLQPRDRLYSLTARGERNRSIITT